MKKFLAVLGSVVLVVSLATPAATASSKYTVNQRTLATFSGNSTLLTDQQRAQVRATVEANPDAEKFICTGIRFHSQPMSMNIMVRKRAKAACDYAKELNPNLSTWFQNKPTMARSYAGKVLLTVKTAAGSSGHAKPALPDYPALSTIETTVEACKLRGSVDMRGFKGFPAGGLIPHSGPVKVALIPLDFSNAPGDPEIGARLSQHAEYLAEWSSFWSRGQMTYEVQTHDDWIRAPLGADWYQFPEGHGKGVRKQSDAKSLNQILEAADPYFDFSGIDFVAVFVPAEAELEFNFGVYGIKTAQTQEGPQSFFAYGGLGLYDGTYEPGPLLVHEILHPQGFLGHGPANGEGYGILMNQWGKSKAISSWEAFVAGWWGDEEYLCVDAQNIQGSYRTTLSSLEASERSPKSTIIRLSHEEAIVVEYRGDMDNVLTAYKLNVNKPWVRDDSGGAAADERSWWQYLRESDGDIPIENSVAYSGLEIVNLGSGSFAIKRITSG